jgi:hypothetical protein
MKAVLDPNMKVRLIILSLLISSTCLAQETQEIKFTTTPWDSLAIPLDISAYYLTVDSSTKGGSVALELDLYIKGRFIRTMSPVGSMSVGDTKPLKANFALYLDRKNKEKIQLICVVDLPDQRMESKKIDLLPWEFPINECRAALGCNTKIAASGRTPVFILHAGGYSFKVATVPEDAPKQNPDGSIIIAYLKTQ